MSNQNTEMWEAFRKGDKVAFETILVKFYRPMFDYGRYFQNDSDQLKDDIHDLMLHLWERRAHLNETPNVKLYLFKALRHQIFRTKNKQQEISRLEETHENELPVETEQVFPFISEEFNNKQRTSIRIILDQLPKRQQEILHLKFYEDLSNEQISSLLGISRGAVANLLYIALKSFRSLWQTAPHLLIILFSFL
jgi:RNA polymerase sigma factor (sigma-70 family)